MHNVIYWLSLLMIFMMPWEGTFVLPGLGTISRSIGILVAALWALSVCVSGRFPKILPFHGIVFLFFAWNAASVLWSIDPDLTLKRLFVYVRMAGLIMVIWDLYRTPTSITAAIQAFILGAYVPAISTIGNFATGAHDIYDRYSATATNANTTAIILVFAVLLAWRLVCLPNANPRMWALWLLNATYLLTGVFAIALTATRFAWIALIPMLIYTLTTLSRFRPALRVLIALGVIGSLSILFIFVPQSSLQRLQSTPDELISGTLTGRTDIWKAGFNVWAEHPLIGIGSGAFHTASAPYFNRPRSAHNSFIAILVELGLIGLILFGVMLTTVAAQAWCQPKWDALFWLTVLAVWGVGNIPMILIHVKSTWLLFGLLVTSAHVSRQNAPQAMLTRV